MIIFKFTFHIIYKSPTLLEKIMPEEKPIEKITTGRTVALILIGAAMGASGDVFMPSANNGTLSDIVSDATLTGVTWGLLDKFAWKKQTGYALNSAGLIAFGSAVGQTLYQYFKQY